jgi:branched-chain amino acid transport system permease protein
MLTFYAQHSKLIDQIGINALLALSLVVSLQAGQLALAQAAFMGVGAYAGAVLGASSGWPLAACAVAGSALGAAVAALLSYPIGRLRGVFLAIATIGFGEIIRIIVNNMRITGGAEGLSGIPNDADTRWIYGCLALVCALFFLLRQTKFALAMTLTREDEAAARGVGIDTAGIRFWTLVAGGAIAGLGGVLYAHNNFFIQPGDFAFGRAEGILVYCVIGGTTSPIGAMLGAALISLLPEIFRFLADYRDIVNGGILLLVVLFAPRGISTLWKRSAGPAS